MKVSIDDKSNRIITKLKVSSTINSWNKEYEAMIDTGAFNTAIPVEDVIPPDASPPVHNLKLSGVQKVKAVGGFEDNVGLYEASLLVGEEDSYPDAKVVAVKLDCAIIGREILKKYRWEIDFEKRQVSAIKSH